ARPAGRPISPGRGLPTAEELPCATRILTSLATKAYRRPVTQTDVDGLLKFYTAERAKNGFEGGIRTAIQAMLASPHFIFRLEEAPSTAQPGQMYRISDIDLASRLSFFV